jgi:hypothetical protein
MPTMLLRHRSPARVGISPRLLPGVLARVATVIAGAVGATAAQADVYKCAGDGGTPVYQETPCVASKELRNFQIDPPDITVLPGKTTANAISPPAAKERPAKDARTAKPDKPGKPKGDASERRHAHAGMSEGEVLAKLGTPDMTAGRRSQKQARWTWLPAPGDSDTITTLILVGGVVTGVERKVVKK